MSLKLRLAISFLLAIYTTNVLWHLAEQRRETKKLNMIYEMYEDVPNYGYRGLEVK